jgi:hypothetical protein
MEEEDLVDLQPQPQGGGPSSNLHALELQGHSWAPTLTPPPPQVWLHPHLWRQSPTVLPKALAQAPVSTRHESRWAESCKSPSSGGGRRHQRIIPAVISLAAGDHLSNSSNSHSELLPHKDGEAMEGGEKGAYAPGHSQGPLPQQHR